MSSYDRALTVFSPDGHLFQVEYAMEAVQRGTLAVGVRCRDGVVFAVERKSVPDLQDARPVRKICPLDRHLLCTFAGLNADARVLIDKARVECQNHRLNYEDAADVDHISRYVASLQQKYTQKGGVRPFGVCTLIAGIDGVKGEPRLFLTEPSGVYSEWYAAAIGRSSKSVREFLEAHYTTDVGSPNGGNGDDGNGPRELGMLCKELTMAAGVKLAVRALLEVVQSGAQFVEVATLDLQGSVRFLPEADVKALIEDLERSAQQSSSTLAPQQ